MKSEHKRHPVGDGRWEVEEVKMEVEMEVEEEDGEMEKRRREEEKRRRRENIEGREGSVTSCPFGMRKARWEPLIVPSQKSIVLSYVNSSDWEGTTLTQWLSEALGAHRAL